MKMHTLPKARNEKIVLQNLKDEVLIYDLNTNRAFCLNETLAVVFNHCDGLTSFDELGRKYHLTGEVIYFALDELAKNDLLAAGANYDSPFRGLTRREVVRRVGLTSLVALPVILSLVVPISADVAAASCQGNSTVCTANSQCCTKNCYVTKFDGPMCCSPTTTGLSAGPTARVGCDYAGDNCASQANQCCSGMIQSMPNSDFCPRAGSLYGCYCM